MAKLSLLVGLGAGYVLGARAGRERYEQIVSRARSVWQDPRVQEKADQAGQAVKAKADQTGQAVKDQLSSVIGGSDDEVPGPPATSAATRGGTLS